jgi:hypothetical protein
MIAYVAPGAAGRRDIPIHTIGTVLGHIHSGKRCRQVKRFAQLAITFIFASGSAAVVAYLIAHIAHHDLGFSRSALRQQALICAALVVGLVTIELLASKER